MPTSKQLQTQLQELTDIVDRLITHVEVLAVAVRKRGSVPQADLDEVLNGVGELRSRRRPDGDEDEAEKKPSATAKKAKKAR